MQVLTWPACRNCSVRILKSYLSRAPGGGTTNRWQDVVMIWRQSEVPVIAGLHGEVFGAGLQLALGADIRIASPQTQIAVMEMK